MTNLAVFKTPDCSTTFILGHAFVLCLQQLFDSIIPNIESDSST